LRDIEKWLASKGPVEPWKHFLNNPEIVKYAHNFSSKYVKGHFVVKQKIVDIGEFRTFLVHLFVISILWIHFYKADEFQDFGDAFNNRLSLLEFKLAVLTFCASYEHEEIDDEQITADFALLCSGGNTAGVTFAEVCNFCCQFIHPQHANHLKVQAELFKKQPLQQHQANGKTMADRILALTEPADQPDLIPSIPLLQELTHRPNASELDHIIVIDKADYHNDSTSAALESVLESLDKHLQVVQLTELKFSTAVTLHEQGVVEVNSQITSERIDQLKQQHQQQQEGEGQ